MATPTYDLLDSVTLTSSQTSINFTGIPQTYKELVVRATVRSVYFTRLRMTVNSNTNSDYQSVMGFGTGGSAYGYRLSNGNYFRLGDQTYVSSGTDSIYISTLGNYSSSQYKSIVCESADTNATGIMAGTLQNTSAVTSVNMFLEQGDFTSTTKIELYGVAG
tara:strand:+ start:145 stop:630 length:486 start_codon:yes stop_codon:yes gene_type:complete